jgi:RND family efflux transporter MFP subunit
MAAVRAGTAATLELASSGVTAVEAPVDFVYPTLSEDTRTLRVRFVVANPDGAIRPGAFGTAVFHLAPSTALVVPRDAIVDGGNEQHVFVAMGGGRFEPRTVRTGARFDDRIEVLEGLREGERIASAGVFLLDSESRLRASGGSGAHAGMVMPGDATPPANGRPAPASGSHDGMDMGGQAR